MSRWKDANWNVGGRLKDGFIVEVSEQGQIISLLMDLRDEIQRLNSLLHCKNFTDIPRLLRGIRRKLPAPRKRRKTTTTKRRRVR